MKNYYDYDYNDTPRNNQRGSGDYEHESNNDFDEYNDRDRYNYDYSDDYDGHDDYNDYDDRYDTPYDDGYDAPRNNRYNRYADNDEDYTPRDYGQTAPRPNRRQPGTQRATHPQRPRQQPLPEENYNHDDQSYRQSNNTSTMEKASNFRRRHPVLMHMIYIIIASILLIWMMLWFLDYWTFHGQERVVPDVKGQSFEIAESNADLSGLRAIISDSIFDNYSRPGTVVEQTPIPGAKIKKGGTVYLTVVAFSPKLVTVPDFYNVSARQARSMFEGAGIKEIREVTVISEYRGLVLGAKFNGVALQPGARIPISAVVTLEVGSGLEEAVETGIITDTLTIDETIDELNIE